MKIEFRKVPQTPKEFQTDYNSVRIEGTFCKISPSLVKVESKLTGTTSVDCIRCAEKEAITLNEDLNFLISDGIYKSDSHDEELVIIEVEDSFINFDEIIESEVSSIYTDYHVCANCMDTDLIEKEY